MHTDQPIITVDTLPHQARYLKHMKCGKNCNKQQRETIAFDVYKMAIHVNENIATILHVFVYILSSIYILFL